MPTGISSSGCLGSCSLNNKPPLPLSNRPTYGSQNITLNRLTEWDDEGSQCKFFVVYVISDVKGWRRSTEAERSKRLGAGDQSGISTSAEINLTFKMKTSKTYILVNSSIVYIATCLPSLCYWNRLSLYHSIFLQNVLIIENPRMTIM